MPSSAHRPSLPLSRVLGAPLLILTLLLVSMALALRAGASVSTSVGGWYWQDLAAPATLNGVAFSDASHGWAVGGTITYTAAIVTADDGGATWTDQDAGGVATVLNAVAATDADHAWAVGTGGHILATTDGGATWLPQASGTTQELTAAAFTDVSHGWVVGRGSVILVTANGGATWTPQAPGVAEDLSGVAFPDALHGWAVSETYDYVASRYRGRIIATIDGGANWSTQVSDVADEFTGATFVGAIRGWAVTFDGTAYKTVDGGTTWTHAQMATGSVHPTAVAFTDASHGWAVGGTEDEPWGAMVWATSNGGATWALQARPGGPEDGVNAVAFPDSTHGWAVGNGAILATDTGGRSPLTLRLSGLVGSSLWLGKTLKASGTALPVSLAGSKVTLTLQRKRGAKWVKVKSTARTIAASGSFSWTYKPAARGSYRMRSAMGRVLARPPMASAWVPFKVR
jgi:photosystem II stability/assembly factor-like uncharacterized protein